MTQLKLGKTSKVLKLKVGVIDENRGYVMVLNPDDFEEIEIRLINCPFGENAELKEVIEHFKELYNVNKVEIGVVNGRS